MPEGPSILILKERIQELHLEGQKVLEVSGNSKIDQDRLLQQKVIAFKSWGKHFLICFKDFTVRIHLMMFGTYRINEQKESVPRLRLQFKDDELNFYTCSVQLLEGPADDIYDWSADVLSDYWDSKAAVKKIKSQSDKLICDLLLDQNIFAGVGNIIKNEVLYRMKVMPENTAAAIPPKKLLAICDDARTYSFKFLEWKKANVLKRNWLIYHKKQCPLNHTVTKDYLGKTKRQTFFCPVCQKQYKNSSTKKEHA